MGYIRHSQLERILGLANTVPSPHRYGVTVIKRDVRKIIPILDSHEFKANPDVLDQEGIPEVQVASLAHGY